MGKPPVHPKPFLKLEQLAIDEALPRLLQIKESSKVEVPDPLHSTGRSPVRTGKGKPFDKFSPSRPLEERVDRIRSFDGIVLARLDVQVVIHSLAQCGSGEVEHGKQMGDPTPSIDIFLGEEFTTRVLPDLGHRRFMKPRAAVDMDVEIKPFIEPIHEPYDVLGVLVASQEKGMTQDLRSGLGLLRERPNSSDHQILKCTYILDPMTSPPVVNQRAPQGLRIGNFDLLRLLFALGVVYTHAVRFLDGDNHREILQALFGIQSRMGFGIGDLGVCGFFAISGFLISGAWERSPRLGAFIRNRLLRIGPGFVLASTLSQTLFVVITDRRIPSWIHEIPWKTRLLELATLNPPSARFPFFVGKFYALERPWVNGSMWTLLHEVRCYFLAGVVGLVSTFILKRKDYWIWSIILGGMLALVALGYQIPRIPGYQTLIAWQTFWMRFIGCFATGALFRQVHRYFPRNERLIPALAALLGICLAHESWLPLALPTVWALLVLQVGTSPTLSRILPHPTKDLSYGTFLYAWPIQIALLHHFPDQGLWFHLPVAAALSLGMGWASWTLIESPALRWKISTKSGRFIG